MKRSKTKSIECLDLKNQQKENTEKIIQNHDY